MWQKIKATKARSPKERVQTELKKQKGSVKAVAQAFGVASSTIYNLLGGISGRKNKKISRKSRVQNRRGKGERTQNKSMERSKKFVRDVMELGNAEQQNS